MANISDSAGIFVGPVLDAFNQMQTYIARDGDLTGAQDAMLKAMTDVNHIKTVVNTSNGRKSTTTSHRAQ